jgi:uncharacterized membrane protein YeaQ/YmgE (transglycosylase-associated protein family)
MPPDRRLSGVNVILLYLLVWGLFCGWLANIILGRGSRPAEWWPLLVAGLAGSLVGGTLLNLIVERDLEFHFSGFVGSVVGAVIVLAVTEAVRNR